MVGAIHPASDYAVLILAAGASRRMGQAKQLLPWGDTTLLGHTLDQVRQVSIRRKYLLLGSRAEQIMTETDITGFIPLVFSGWEEGMGAGISYALNNMLNDLPELKGVMVTLGDQPLVNTALLTAMLNAHGASGKPMLACAYGDRAGVPAIISGKYLDHLQRLKGDRGARRLFTNFPDDVHHYLSDVPLTDIDDPESYRQSHFDIFGRYPYF